MATRDTLWTCVGITKHVGENDKEVVKVRCGVDLARRVKSSLSKSYVKSKGEKLTVVRADFIELPNPMLRADALIFALAATEFQSPEDQALIQETIDTRATRSNTTGDIKKKITSARTSKKTSLSLDSIKQRTRLSSVIADSATTLSEQTLVQEVASQE